MTDKEQEREQDDWESEGGATASVPTQKTPKGLEIPLPKRKRVIDALRNPVRPVKTFLIRLSGFGG